MLIAHWKNNLEIWPKNVTTSQIVVYSEKNRKMFKTCKNPRNKELRGLFENDYLMKISSHK